jgi:phage gpG-like protein
MISITINSNAQEILGRVKSLRERNIGVAIKTALDATNEETVGYIQERYMTGPRPEKLGVITNRLRRSVRRSAAQIVGESVLSSIGSNVEYAAIHEFGGTIRRVTKPGKVRLRTDAGGNLQRNYRGGAIFATAKHKRAREVSYSGGKSYEIVMPERSFIRRGIEDRAPVYTQRISSAIQLAWNGGAA